MINEILFLLAILLLTASALASITNYIRRRFQLVGHVKEHYPELWSTLHVSDSLGEGSGFSPKFVSWIATGAYRDLDDAHLTDYCISYQRAKFITIPCVLLCAMTILILVKMHS